MPGHVTPKTIKECYPKKQEWSHKGDFGRLLVIGGSRTYSGAPALSALAAMRMGTDLVHVCAPERAANIIASSSPDLIAEPIRAEYFSRRHAKFLIEKAKSFDAVVIGGGLGKRPDTAAFVRSFLSLLKKPCVVDADAIAAVSGTRAIKGSFVLTPHAGEFSLLSGSAPSKDLKAREQETRKLAGQLNTTVLLKGMVDVISDGKETLLNRTGNPWMTKGGTGDILAGVCGGFLAMGNPPFRAACAGAFLTGLAGDLAEREIGPGLISSDIVAMIPRALRPMLG